MFNPDWNGSEKAAKKKKPDPLKDRALDLTGQLPSLPHTCACSTIGAEGLNFRVRDGNGWDPLAKVTQNLEDQYDAQHMRTLKKAPNSFMELWIEYLTGGFRRRRKPHLPQETSDQICVENKFYGQAERAISSSKLNVLLRLHICPIKLVVFQCSSYFRWEISS